MWATISVLLALVALWLGWRVFRMSLLFRDLADGAERRQGVLIDKPVDRMPGSAQLHRLQAAVNRLIDETKSDSRRDRGLLHHIETTMGNIREGILVLDEDYKVRVANLAMRNFLGNNRPLVGQRLESLVQSAAFLEYVRQVKSGVRAETQVVEVEREEGAFWFEINGTLLPQEQDLQGLAVFVLHDITQLKRLEQIRTEFIANVSHELRTPVTIIKGFTDTLVDEGESLSKEERERFLGRVQRNVVRMHLLLEDLLTLARLESREEQLHREDTSINSLAREVVENFQGRVGEGVSVDVDLDPTAPVMPVDSLRLTQVLENLMENAVRHAKSMTLLVIHTRVEGQRLRCTVEDNGCGIPPRHLPHLFERFYRVDKGRSRDVGGTGLGLSISKHIVQQHGGSVFVESQQGQGTRIGFLLPIPGDELGK